MNVSMYIVRRSKSSDCEHGGDPDDMIYSFNILIAEKVFLGEKKRISELDELEGDEEYDEVLLLSATLGVTPPKYAVVKQYYWGDKE